ncbi:Cyclin-dependent kinase 2-associated protein 1 [Formica fusca]
MAKQHKNVGVTAKIMEPLLTIPNTTSSQQTVSVSVSVSVSSSSVPAQSKYVKLLRIIEQLGRDLKPFYTGSKLRKTMPKVERDLMKACRLVKQCRVEATKSSKKAYQ